MNTTIKIIAFDADDTLWVNEPYFQATEQKFCSLLTQYLPASEISQLLLDTEIQNLKHYGYGIKSFVLSMMETAHQVSQGQADSTLYAKIIRLGKEMMDQDVILLPGIEQVLKQLNGERHLVVATKGDLVDQKRKLDKSGIAGHFHHIEIMSDKKLQDYQKLLQHLNCKPEELLMVGNSLKSDILPVLELGGHAVYIPFHSTWEHEKVNTEVEHPKYFQLKNIIGLPELLATL